MLDFKTPYYLYNVLRPFKKILEEVGSTEWYPHLLAGICYLDNMATDSSELISGLSQVKMIRDDNVNHNNF